MAKKAQTPTEKAAPDGGADYPEGTHPAVAASDTTHSATNWQYRDMPDDRKPDPSSVVQEQVLQGDEASAGGQVAAENA